jgi:hypothetical protein
MWTDGQTDITKLTVAFRNFANAPKNWPLASIAHAIAHLHSQNADAIAHLHSQLVLTL